MIITSVRIYPFLGLQPAGTYRILAYASVNLDKDWRIDHIRITESAEGRRIVALPSVKNQRGEHKDVVYPLNDEARTELREIVLEALKAGRFTAYRPEQS